MPGVELVELDCPNMYEDFRSRFEFVHKMTADFLDAVPDDHWDFSPDPPESTAGLVDPLRHGRGFAPFCKQLRHVVCVRGVYSDALVTGGVDFSRKHQYFTGELSRSALSDALASSRDRMLYQIESVDRRISIDFFGSPFSFGDFAFTVVQHEAIHHGQWSVYASLAGFETPLSWREQWGL
jgi:hypothetical protein